MRNKCLQFGRHFLHFTLFGVALLCGRATVSDQQVLADPSQISVTEFDRQVHTFIERQVTAHISDIRTLDPAPQHVVGALTSGEFSWGTFMRTVAAYSSFSGTTSVAGQDIPKMIGEMAEIELSHGGKTWAQLYAAMALESFGTDLNKNALWQSLSPAQRKSYLTLLDPHRFYDEKTQTLIHLPENYFGVAARIAAIDNNMGVNTDRAMLDNLLTRAAKQFLDGALFADDALPSGRYDRYSNEYARSLYEAAAMVGRDDILKVVTRSLKVQMKLWWDLLSEDGYGYSWGRSLGAISYMDTMEIAAFLGRYPELRPAPLSQLAAAYFAAWSWLRRDFNEQTHLLSIFAFGRGDYSYITKDREWQQTTTFFAKVIDAQKTFIPVLATEGIQSFPSRPSLHDVARFQFFSDAPGRKFGVWVIRQGPLHFALPFVTGPLPATSDYEPVPDGLAGFATPVEKMYPCLVPFLELDDGQTIAPVDGADEISPATDGKSVTARWRRWVVVGSKPGELVDPDVVSEVSWAIEGNNLRSKATLTASRTLHVRRLWFAVPSRYDHLKTLYVQGTRIDEFSSDGKRLEVELRNFDLSFDILAYAPGNDPLGRGDRGPIPIHLRAEAKDFSLQPDIPRHWELCLSVQ